MANIVVRIVLVLGVAVTATAADAGVALAQMPGGRGVNVDLQRSQFTEVMLQAARAQVGAWLAVWRGESDSGLERQYAPTATLIPPGGTAVQGEEEIAAFGRAAVPQTADANITITDFEASEGIAYLYGNYSFVPLRAGEPMSSGQHISVMQREGRDWRLRAQLYAQAPGAGPHPPAGTAGSPTANAASRPRSMPAAAPSAAAGIQHDALVTLNALRAAWAARDADGAAALFAANGLLHMPGSEQPVRGPLIPGALTAALDTFAALHTALVDFGSTERLSWLLSRYYLEPRTGAPLDGYLMIVLAGQPRRREIRALVFTTPQAPAAAGHTVAVGAASGAPLEARIDSIFAEFAGSAGPGCTVSAVRGDDVVQRSYGMARVRPAQAITSQSTFYAASVSKQFTAFAVALLADEGRLSLEDDIRTWLPELPDFGATITLRHLLHHTSGLRDYLSLLNLSGWPVDGALSEAGFLDLISRQRALNFAPGSEHLYSNTGYVLLSIIIERATGRPLREFAATSIFEPLGMNNTGFRDDATAPIRDQAIGYVRGADGAWTVSVPGFEVVGDGGLYTTIEDLARWERAAARRSIGSAAAWELMETRGRLEDGRPIAYALGLSIGEYRGLRTIQHGGAYGGYRAHVLRVPDHDAGVITLCNTAAANASELSRRVAEAMLAEHMSMPATAATTANEAAAPSPAATHGPADTAGPSASPAVQIDAMRDYAGSFYSEELGVHWRFEVVRGELMLYRIGAEPQRLVSRATDTYGTGTYTLRFERDASGTVTHVLLDAPRVRALRFDFRR